MTRHFCFIVAIVLGFSSGTIHAEFPTDEEVLAILRARVDTFKQSTGIVVGMVDSTGTRFVSYGTTHAGGSTPVDEHTIFEIGSISKVFTSLLLTDMVLKDELDLRDPVATHLPPNVTPPTMGSRQITFKDLVTHRSGLPRMPDNFTLGSHAERGYYSVDSMYAFLSTCTLVADIDEKFLYSNLGYGLLGEALAHRAGADFETVLLNRICEPLGLRDTRFRLSEEHLPRQAGGHDWNHRPVPLLNFDAMRSAGGLRSTAADLTRFLAHNIGLIDSDLWHTLQMSHIDREDAFGRKIKIGMGWLLLDQHGRELVFHNGATFGNMAFSAFDKEARRGVVLLANARGIYDDIGFYLMDPEAKLFRFKEAPEDPVAADIDIEKLRPLVGEYAIASNQILIIRIEDGKILGNYNEGVDLEMKAVSETELFFESTPFVAEFLKNKEGNVTEVIWRAYGEETRGKKLEFYRSPPKRAPGNEDLSRYAGRYEVSDDLTIRLDVEDGVLVARSGAQLPLKLVRTPDGFFSYEARAEIVFQEADGEVIGLTLHQDGIHDARRLAETESEMP